MDVGNRIRISLICFLCGGAIPKSPVDAIWELIDEEKRKPENEIRCDVIEAWEEAAQRVKKNLA